MKRSLFAAFIAGSLVASLNALASEDEEFLLEARNQNGVIYLSGGVGLDERDAMQAVQHQYTLWLSFVQMGDATLSADTEVAIRDAKGKLILEATAEGPWLMVKLPAGRYRVNAQQDDAWGSQTVTVGRKGVTRQAVRLNEKESG